MAYPARRVDPDDHYRQIIDATVREPDRQAEPVEVDLDDEPEELPEPGQLPQAFAEVQVRDHHRAPIIPASLRRPNLKATVGRTAEATAHRAAFHAVRIPLYVPLALFWAVVGVFRLAGRQISWWWVTEQHGMRQAAASAGDADAWYKLHREAKATRSWRGYVLLGELVALVVAVALLVTVAPWLVRVLVVVVAVPLLAHVGRPDNRPIVTAAIIAPRFRKLTLDVVLRAYYVAGLGNPDREDKRVTFAPPGAARDGDGTRIVVDLPHGKGYDDVLKARGALASGLDVATSQVFLTPDPTSHRRHVLWVADRDPLAIPAGPAPLLDCKPRDIWRPAPIGLDERGQVVYLDLLWNSFLIGAQPRKGKTFFARLVALYAALDPYVVIVGADGKLSPDWNSFPLVAHRWVFGTHPNPRDRDPIAHLINMLTEVEEHIADVNEFLSKLPTQECPDGKLTRELSRRYARLRVWLLIVEEFQLYFETIDQDANKVIAAKLSNILATGPSAGVILISSSQKPSGIGAGDVSRLFNRYRDNHAVRFALKCGNRDVSMAILGGDAYQEGFDASALPNGKPYRGVGYLYGASDDTPTVRSYLATAVDAEAILTAARASRERLGLLTGAAAGEEAARQVRDVLADVRRIWVPSERGAHFETIAARLAAEIPDAYHGVTAEVISAQLRALGVPAQQIKTGGVNRWGVRLTAIEDLISRRAIDGGQVAESADG